MASSECNWQDLQLKIDDGVANLTLARPEIGNAFDEQMIASLIQAFTVLAGDVSVKAVVLRAQGKNFCTGADLKWMQKASQFTQAENEADAMRLSMMLQLWHSLPKPTIALVHGACYGGGVGLVAASDLVVMESNSRFCLSEVKLGLIPAVISPYLIAAMGQRQAQRVMLTAELINSEFARRIGLAHEVGTDQNSCEGIVADWLKLLKANSANALSAVKGLIATVSNRHFDSKLQTDLAKSIAEIRVSPDAQARMRAFLESR